MVFYFTKANQVVGENAAIFGEQFERDFNEKGLGQFSKEKAVFVVVFQPEEKAEGATALTGEVTGKTEAKAEVDPSIPVSPLESTDLFKTFGAKVGDTVVTDWFGYDAKKYSTRPSMRTMTGAVDTLSTSANNAEKKATKAWEAVLKTEEKKADDTRAILDSVIKVLRIDRRGLDGVEKAVVKYAEIVEKVNSEIAEAEAAGNVEKLTELKSAFRRTVLEDNAKAAIERAEKKAASTTHGAADGDKKIEKAETKK